MSDELGVAILVFWGNAGHIPDVMAFSGFSLSM